jgi:hypothetical protein
MYVCVTDILFWYLDLCDGLVAVVDVKLIVEGILSHYRVKSRYIGDVDVVAMLLILRFGVPCCTNEMGVVWGFGHCREAVIYIS